VRNVTSMTAAAMLLASLVGCSDAESAARRKLAQQLDEARRRYAAATAILAVPPYMDRSSGQVWPVGRRLTEGELRVPTTQPAENPKAVKLLRDAAAGMTAALSANDAAPDAAKAEARLLLGNVQTALGRYYAMGAEQLRNRAAAARRSADVAMDLLRNSAGLAKFNEALAGLSRDNVHALRDRITRRAERVGKEIEQLDARIAALQQEIGRLQAASDALVQQANALRDRSRVRDDEQGLELLKQSNRKMSQVAANANAIAGKQEEIASLQAQKARLAGARQTEQLKLQAIAAHLGKMDSEGSAAKVTMEAFRRLTAEHQRTVEAHAVEAARLCRAAAEKEQAALGEFLKAAGSFRQAERLLDAAMRKARDLKAGLKKENPIVENLLDDQHKAMAVAAKAAAHLEMAELRSRQLATAKANAALASKIQQAWRRLGDAPPKVVAELKAYLPETQETHDQAVKDYQAAEKDLEALEKSMLRRAPGRNTKWIHQACLASAYLGHYELTGDENIRVKASQFVEQALSGKEGSPYLEPVVRLRELLASQ